MAMASAMAMAMAAVVKPAMKVPIASGSMQMQRCRCVRSVRRFSVNGNGPSRRQVSDVTESSRVEEGYVGLYVRLLGLDHPIDEREEAAQALWRHSEGGKDNIEEIIKFPDCVNLAVRLISCDRADASEAAAGLLREIAALGEHRALVVDSGAIEEIANLLTRQSAPFEVREQATHVLRNLSSEEAYRSKIANQELLPVLVSMLASEQQGECDAAAGLIGNLAKSESNHRLLLEAGVVHKMANLLKAKLEKVSKTARQEARTALFELSKNTDTRMAIIEEGLMFVPLIGASAYQSVKPLIDAMPMVPENVILEHELGSQTSPFGAGDLLLGLHVGKNSREIDEATDLANEGRIKLRFLARLGLLGKEERPSAADEDGCRYTIMPWWDAIPRLVLILGIKDVNYAKLGAQAVAEIAFTEKNRQQLVKAGAVPHLIYLLGSGDESTMEAASHALENLSKSHEVGRSIYELGAIPPLVAILKANDAPEYVQEKAVGALANLSRASDERNALQAEAVIGIKGIVGCEGDDDGTEAKIEAENVLNEISALRSGPRDKIVYCGGVPALVKLLFKESSVLKVKALNVLQSIATRESHALCMLHSGVDRAFKSILQADLQEGGTKEVVRNGVRILGRVLKYESIMRVMDCECYEMFLSKILKTETTDMELRDWVSDCLGKLRRRSSSTSAVSKDLEGNSF